MAAIRIARGYTGKDIVIKLDGHFHGMHEMVWYNHNNYPPIVDGVCETVPDSAGIPHAFTDLIKVAESNNLEAVAKLVEKYKGNVAAIIIEPICFNMGCSMMKPRVCARHTRNMRRRGHLHDNGRGDHRSALPSGQRGRLLRRAAGHNHLCKGSRRRRFDIARRRQSQNHGYLLARRHSRRIRHLSGNQLGVYAANACVSMALEDGFYDHIEAFGSKLFSGMEDLMKSTACPAM